MTDLKPPILMIRAPSASPMFTLGSWCSVLEPVGFELAWSVHFLWALSREGEVEALSPANSVVVTDHRNIACDWTDIVALSRHTHQVIDGVFIARQRGTAAPAFTARPSIVELLETPPEWQVWLEACDSDCWFLATADKKVLARTRDTFGSAARSAG